ncbi:hypothetical protein XELAEV_18031193mg [Xenopus laevis]|uniref:Uncharacterized protein n=1 Tax=Xenopus laevis TaxID=8355 RepID=A0A974HFT7_XENLA|nr:hypothetical protein XELAEV_18031193mg [Xenopus laevis]
MEEVRDKVSNKPILVYREIEGARGCQRLHSEASLTADCASPCDVVPLEGNVPLTVAVELILSGWTADVNATPTQWLVAPGGDTGTQQVIGAPACCLLPLLQQEKSLERVWHVLEADAAFRPEAAPVSMEEETLQPVLMLGKEDPSESSAPLGVEEAMKVQMMLDSTETDTSLENTSHCTVLVSDSGPCGDLTVTISFSLVVPTPTTVIGHDVDWSRFSFGWLGPIVPVAPTFRDPPLLEEDEDPLDKLFTSSVDSEGESMSEAPEQILCKCRQTVASDPAKSVHPKVVVPKTLSEPGESSNVAALYHFEWGKISLEREENLFAAIPKYKDDYSLGKAPGWEEYKEETPEAEHEPGPPMEMPHSFTAPPKIGPEEEKDFWVLPGWADPNVFTSVYRVQRVINFQVYRAWGYVMLYAPLWVYEKVAASYENWLIDEILRKEKRHPSCLTNPDKVRHEQDWQYLRSIEKEWWYGRTILKNAVKSCGKYNPTNYFNLQVYMGDGEWVDKPHTKYYIPYEDTKAHFLHMICAQF